MPLLDHLRLTRFTRAAAPSPAPPAATEPVTRLDRMVARQKTVRLSTEIERRIEAMEEEFSEPLYDSSAYGSASPGAREE